MSANSDKKSKFGTLSVVTVFIATFLVVFVILTFLVFFLSLKLTGTQGDSFGGVLLLAIILIPTIAISAVIAWLISHSFASSMQSQLMPENYTAKLILRGVSMLIPAWIAGWIIWNIYSSHSSPSIYIPIIISALIQIMAITGLGLLGKSSDKSRREIWSVIICLVIFITPVVALKIVAT